MQAQLSIRFPLSRTSSAYQPGALNKYVSLQSLLPGKKACVLPPGLVRNMEAKMSPKIRPLKPGGTAEETDKFGWRFLFPATVCTMPPAVGDRW
jgi:hypothetical protein